VLKPSIGKNLKEIMRQLNKNKIKMFYERKLEEKKRDEQQAGGGIHFCNTLHIESIQIEN